MHSVIGFMEIKLQEYRPLVLGADFVKDLVEDQDPIQDKTALNESRLIGVGDRVGEPGHPIGVPFGQDPKDHIDHSDGSELADVRRTRNFGDKSDYPVVQAPKIHGP